VALVTARCLSLAKDGISEAVMMNVRYLYRANE